MAKWTWDQIGMRDAVRWFACQSPTRFEANPLWLQVQHGESICVRILRDGEVIAMISLLKIDLKFGYRYIWSPAGPVIATQWRDRVESDFWEYLFTIAWKEWVRGGIFEPRDNIVFWRFEPDVPNVSFPERWKKALRKIKDIQPAATSRVSLVEGFDVALARMHQKTRYNMRLAFKKGIVVSEITDPTQMLDAVDLILDTARRDGYRPHIPEHYHLLWALGQSPNFVEDSAMSIKFLGAFSSEGSLVAVAIISVFGDTWTYMHGGSDKKHRALMAPYAIQAYAMTEAAVAGAHWYDLYGIDHPDDKKQRLAGVSRFKDGFAGVEDIRPGTFDLPADILAYFAFRAARFLRGLAR